MGEDDFNRLYERLVGRRTRKKLVTPTVVVYRTDDVDRDAVASKEAEETARREEMRRKEREERDALVYKVVKRMKLGRNLRGFSRLGRCSPHRLAFQLVSATEQDERVFLQKYRRVTRQRAPKKHRDGRIMQLKRYMRLEGVAARLYVNSAASFRNDAKSTVEGRNRVMDELLFFSPVNSRLKSRIGYADQDNVVPPPPVLRSAYM